MAEIISVLGKPPEEVWNAWEKRNEFFNDDGTWIVESTRRYGKVSSRLEERVAYRMEAYGPNFTADEKATLVRMLKGMLTYTPEERWTIEQVLECEWMERFGKPAVGALDERVDKSVLEDTGIVKRAPEVRREVIWLEKDEDGDMTVVRVEDAEDADGADGEMELADGDHGGEV